MKIRPAVKSLPEVRQALEIVGGYLSAIDTGSGVCTDNAPKPAEIEAIFGTAANAGVGYLAHLYDSTNTDYYLVVTDGTDWFYSKMAKATA